MLPKPIIRILTRGFMENPHRHHRHLPHFLPLLFFFPLLLLSPFPPVLSHPPDGTTDAESDSQALLAIRRELVDIRGTLRGWNGSGPCSVEWAGIKCSQGQVVSIQLPWKSLAGRISEQIGLLKSLARISLHDNLITGPLPTSLGSLPNLRAIYLFNNRLSGSIPPTIGNSRSLRILDLSNNFLTSSVPPVLAANSSRLTRLNLSFNSFSESIPHELVRLPSITILALDHNNFSGSIPNSWATNGNSSYYQLRTLTLGYNLISGVIPSTIDNLVSLEVLDLSHNMIEGNVPPQIGRVSALRKLDLSFNLLNGSLPTNVFANLTSLSALKLNNNGLQGHIPSGLSSNSSIREIDLSYNNFSGEIPMSLGGLHNLTTFNVSYNNFSGTVPPLLFEKFGSAAFVGNLQLCGFSGSTPCPSLTPGSPPSPTFQLPNTQKHHGHHGLRTKDIVLIAAGILLFVLLLLCCFLLCCLCRKRTVQKKPAAAVAKPAKATEILEKSAPVSGESGGKLVHFDGPFVFTADDLLCATAEIMGKSAYGTAYKATLEDGNQVAVKRLREKATKGQKEFESEAAALGRIRHPNLVALRAYYLGPKGEKLLVFDYMPKGSLASFLHARGPETTIGWATRMRIVMDVARGLSNLHVKEDMIHGDLNSTNILLDEDGSARIADYGLSRLSTMAAAAATTVATAGALGYTAPELGRTKKGTEKSDVYSLGVVMLELLTGKSPSEGMGTGEGAEEGGRGEELPRWVASVVKEEWTNEVFDLELLREEERGGVADELLNTLKLALHCVDPSPDSRPDADQVLRQLEEIKPPDSIIKEEVEDQLPSS